MDQLMGEKMGKHGKHGKHLHEMMVIVLRFQRNVLQAPGLWVQKDQPRTQAEIDSLWLGTWQNHGKNMEKSLENHWKITGNSWQNQGKHMGKSLQNYCTIMGTSRQTHGKIIAKSWKIKAKTWENHGKITQASRPYPNSSVMEGIANCNESCAARKRRGKLDLSRAHRPTSLMNLRTYEILRAYRIDILNFQVIHVFTDQKLVIA